MSKVTAISNQKGGVGKSTTSQSLAAGLSLKGRSVLLVDMDSQGNLSLSVGAEKGPGVISIFDVLTGEEKADDAIQKIGDIDIIPASLSLAGADMQLTEMGKEYRLKEALAPLKDKYDHIIIDTPPALGILTVNALTAADNVIMPAQADLYSIEAIGQLYATVQAVRKYTNDKLKISGILLTRYSDRTVLSRELSEMISNTASSIGTKLFSSRIRETVTIREAQAKKKDIFSYAPESKVADDYMRFIDEFIKGE